MNVHFDVIVLGVGSMGSATCYHLAKRGLKVLGLEQASIVHEYGSHHGQSRIIRTAYFEHPSYVPLLKRSYELWRKLSDETGEQLYTETGLLYAGRPNGQLLKGVQESAFQHHISIGFNSPNDIQSKFPTFQFPSSFEIILEPSAGFLSPERCIRAYVSQAENHGAVIKSNSKVMSWKSVGTGVEVVTVNETYSADKLVITAGPWTAQVLPNLKELLHVTRQPVFWIQPRNPEWFTPERFPCWLSEMEDSPEVYYGFPYLDEKSFGRPQGLKIAQHNPGQSAHPDQVDRFIRTDEIEHMRMVSEKIFPGQFVELLHSKVCLYTYSPDEHFIIDLIPDHSNVVFAAGFSGHGFKFSSVMGEALADLAESGSTSLPIGFLSSQRFYSK